MPYAVFTVLTLSLPSLLCNADNECEAETHQTLLLLLLIMRSYANIGAAPRVNPDNCRVRGYNTQLQRGESTDTAITIYFVLLFPEKIEAET